jgi:hypothetical protein
MTTDTILPEVVMDVGETVTRAVETKEKKDWSVEDLKLIANLARLTRDRFAAATVVLHEKLGQGVNAATFLKREEPRFPRLDKLVQRHCVLLAVLDRLQADATDPDFSSAARELTAVWEETGKAMSGLRDLLAEALAMMKAPRRPVDWERIRQAQAAFAQGETKPFKTATKANRD